MPVLLSPVLGGSACSYHFSLVLIDAHSPGALLAGTWAVMQHMGTKYECQPYFLLIDEKMLTQILGVTWNLVGVL
jgi:hypothetical protein